MFHDFLKTFPRGFQDLHTKKGKHKFDVLALSLCLGGDIHQKLPQNYGQKWGTTPHRKLTWHTENGGLLSKRDSGFGNSHSCGPAVRFVVENPFNDTTIPGGSAVARRRGIPCRSCAQVSTAPGEEFTKRGSLGTSVFRGENGFSHNQLTFFWHVRISWA